MDPKAMLKSAQGPKQPLPLKGIMHMDFEKVNVLRKGPRIGYTEKYGEALKK